MSSNNDSDYTEREKQVLELYDSGKSTRDIAKTLRMSLRDISFILKKNQVNQGIVINDNVNNNNNKSPNEKATQSYRLFSQGKKLVEVSIELGLRENEASKYFREYLKLKGQDEVYEIYLENKHHIKSLRKLHRVVKREGITTDKMKLGTYKIPDLQNEYAKLKDEVEAIDYKKTMANHALEDMNNQITILRRALYQLSATCNNKRNEIACLQFGIQELEGYVNGLNNKAEIKNET